MDDLQLGALAKPGARLKLIFLTHTAREAAQLLANENGISIQIDHADVNRIQHVILMGSWMSPDDRIITVTLLEDFDVEDFKQQFVPLLESYQFV